MTKIGTTALLTAALLTSSAASAAAPASGCLTQAEFALMGTAVLPTVLEGVAERCRATLPATAALLRRDDDHWRQLTAAAQEARPTATATAQRLIARGNTPFPKELAKTGDILTVGAAFVSSAIAEDIKPTDCVRIDQGYAELAPLPPANLFRIVSLMLMDKKEPLVCPIEAAPR